MEPSVHVGKRKRNRYTAEFKAEAVRMMRASGKPTAELAKDLGLSEQSLYRWAWQFEIDAKAEANGPLTTAGARGADEAPPRAEAGPAEARLSKKTAAYFCERKAVRFAVVRMHRGKVSVAMMCRLLDVSTSGFHAWAARPESQRARGDRALTVATKAAFAGAKGRYGSPRILRELRSKGRWSSRRRIARIMRVEGLVALPRKRRTRTTDSKHTRRIAPNLLARNFSVDAPNKVWMGDITYVGTPDGWLYQAVVLDPYARNVIGWAPADHMRDDLVIEALGMAQRRRGNVRGVMHHTDRGSQLELNGSSQHRVVRPSTRASATSARPTTRPNPEPRRTPLSKPSTFSRQFHSGGDAVRYRGSIVRETLPRTIPTGP